MLRLIIMKLGPSIIYLIITINLFYQRKWHVINDYNYETTTDVFYNISEDIARDIVTNKNLCTDVLIKLRIACLMMSM